MTDCELIPHPTNKNEYLIGSWAESEWGIQESGHGVLRNVHDPALCAGEPCVVHNPSDHHMRSWPLNWRGDRGLMERLCPCHGVGHPDPDAMYYFEKIGQGFQGVHGCIISNETGLTCCVPPAARS